MSAKQLPCFMAPFLLFTLMNIATLPTAAQNCTNCAGDHVALLEIKSKIKEDPKGLMILWNDSIHFCRWGGVTCNLSHQRVIALNLSNGDLLGSLSPSIANLTFLKSVQAQNNLLSGEIPPEIGRLSLLQELSLFNNSFQGNIPVTLSNLSSLQSLHLGQNILVGNIPASLSNCSNLQLLVLGQNNLVGKIPDELGSLFMLNALILPRNNLSGGIPRFIGNLTSLEILSLGECGLEGSIPDVFHRLSNLTRIALLGNKLVGTIPPSLYNLSSVEILLLDDNRLTGILPANLGSMQPNLMALSIPDNHFTGPLPTSIFSSSVLRVLDLARNNFSGKLVITSREACNLEYLSLGWNHFGSGEDDEMTFIEALSICKNLKMFDIGYNQLKGFLPHSLGNLSNITFLSLASNALSGGLPSSVGNLSGVTSVDLSDNKLTGTIDQVNFGNLRSLRKLDLKNNYFSGNIPDSFGNLSLLLELDLGFNEFNGNVPSSLGNCKTLLKLSINRNNLTGEIPRNLFQISMLSISLNLGGNQLSGQLPQEVGNLKNLNEIILSNNRLSGDLPTTISSCISLVNLDISNNFFQGTLPSSLRSLRALQKLDVSSNNFTGRIPSYLEEIPLENLNISFNGFEGEVWSKGVFANASAVSLVGNNRLCGGVLELRLPECRRSTNPKKKNWLRLAVILATSLVAVLITIVVVLFLVFYRRKKDIKDDISEPTSQDSLILVSYEMLYKATDGFSTKNFIGEGSFSSVFRGNGLDADSGVVAIKVLNLHRRGGSKSFISECEALKNARHRNLAKVITCCSGIDFQGNEFKAIVYEFFPNGTLDQWLHSNVQNKLSLLHKVCIALDVAYALDYLHHHAGKTIVHCDLKPSNILLDEDMVAHVGDFGLSKIFQSEYKMRQHSSSAGVRGTIGYAAPEYGLGSRVSPSGDMYSYGILLLEMITSKKPTDAMFGDGLNLHHYGKEAISVGVLEVVDPVLLLNDKDKNFAMRKNERGIAEKTSYMKTQNCLRLLLEIGVSCSMELPQNRMDAEFVVQALSVVKDDILGISTFVSPSV